MARPSQALLEPLFSWLRNCRLKKNLCVILFPRIPFASLVCFSTSVSQNSHWQLSFVFCCTAPLHVLVTGETPLPGTNTGACHFPWPHDRQWPKAIGWEMSKLPW